MKRVLVVLVLLGLAGGGGYWWWHSHQQAGEQTAQRGSGGGRGRRSGGDPSTPVPVLAAMSEKKDVPIYLDALGTVQAFNLVSIRALVDGPLVEVRFKEGQDVKAGDVLARVDPRPFQASLDAAVAKKQQDEASLANNRADAARYAKLVASNYSSAQQSDTARALVAQTEALVRGDQAPRRSIRRAPSSTMRPSWHPTTAGLACGRSTSAISCIRATRHRSPC